MRNQLKTVLATAIICTANHAIAADQSAVEFRDAFLAGDLAWEDVEARAAQEGQVTFNYWGGSDLINIWMRTYAVPAMQKQGVVLEDVRLTSTKDAIDLVIAEKGAGVGLGEGSVDLIWVNGDNFATLKQQDALFGAFARSLPNSKNFEWSEDDPRSHLNTTDFGNDTLLTEIPWSGEQYICAVDRDFVPHEETPHTFEGLHAHLEMHPGTFTYVKPPHYLGNTFVQGILYSFNPQGNGAAPFQNPVTDFTPEEVATLLEPGFDYIQEIEPLLLDGNTGSARYPESEAALDGLFANREIHIACKFGLYAVSVAQSTGTYPLSAEQFIFPEGAMIKNKSYLAIPSNAGNPAAALLLANWMSSVEAQRSKLQYTGTPAGIDLWTLTDEERQTILRRAPGLVGITQAELDQNAAPDTHASFVNIIETVWLEVVERDSNRPLVDIIADAMERARS